MKRLSPRLGAVTVRGKVRRELDGGVDAAKGLLQRGLNRGLGKRPEAPEQELTPEGGGFTQRKLRQAGDRVDLHLRHGAEKREEIRRLLCGGLPVFRVLRGPAHVADPPFFSSASRREAQFIRPRCRKVSTSSGQRRPMRVRKVSILRKLLSRA